MFILKKMYQFFCVIPERVSLMCMFSVNGKSKILRKYIRWRLRTKYHIIIASSCKIGNDLKIPHPQNIVIGQGVEIGNHCTIYQNVTLGQNKYKYPKISDNVIIYTGANIVGDIVIGKGAIVGASAVVTKNVPDNVIVAGIPAKVIGKREENDYH